jgi:hypothetical protein
MHPPPPPPTVTRLFLTFMHNETFGCQPIFYNINLTLKQLYYILSPLLFCIAARPTTRVYVTRFFTTCFFHESSSLWPLMIILAPFQFFLKSHTVFATKVAPLMFLTPVVTSFPMFMLIAMTPPVNLPPVSMTLAGGNLLMVSMMQAINSPKLPLLASITLAENLPPV